jgi:outer membrane protein OmpA-like peptidoglycan-associated protein
MRKYLSIFATTLGLSALATPAFADNDFSLHLEPGLVQPLTPPQNHIYNTGVVLGAKGLFALNPNLAIGPSVSSLYLSRSVDNGQNAGVLWQVGGSARLQTDRRESNKDPLFGTFSPWLDVDAMFAATGNLIRPAFDVAVGGEVPMDHNHIAWVGPFIRYTHVLQTSDSQDGSALDKRDPNLLQVGISFSFDTPTTTKTKVVEHTVVEEHTTVEIQPVEVPCPPQPAKVVVVTPPVDDSVDLSEIVYFDLDKAVLRWESFDKLNKVVNELKAHPNLNVKVEGHASSDGPQGYNQKLSEKRTAAVMAYLTAHGISASRLTAQSFGEDKPAASNATKEGRERNRRVEFAVNFVLVGTK